MPRMYRIYKRVQQTGVIALGVGTFVCLYHKRSHSCSLLAKVETVDKTECPSPESDLIQGRAAVPSKIAKEGPLILQLKQVQVMFRHGARTPLHLVPKLHEANYKSEYLMREHQASLFPYERILLSTGEPVDWSDYELQITQTPLKSGVCAGALTAYGKDQAYMLGKRLQKSYMDSLNLATYNPNEVFVISSNIKRTVESARCVLAGFFGKEQLSAYSEFCQPVKIYITDKDYNTLIPGTIECDVLKKVNQIAMFNSDMLPGFKEQRLALQKKINEEREKNMEDARAVQKKINLMYTNFKDSSSVRKITTEHNQYCMPYLHDSLFKPLVDERSKIMARVDRLWTDVMVRNPTLSQVITDDDMKALIYLRSVEMEGFGGSISGYRIHFYFDPNPYFYNEHLCKEVYLDVPSNALPSRSIPIMWKKCANLLTDPDNVHVSCQHSKKDEKVEETSTCSNTKERAGVSEALSFFQWYTQPTKAEHDRVGKAIKDQIWLDPIKSLEGKRKHPDKWEDEFNFVNARDDLCCRQAHGIEVPKELMQCEKIIKDNATKMLYYAMTGQGITERSVITRLGAGPLLTAVVDSMEGFIRGKDCSPKLCLYATHDSTLTAMLEALGIWYDTWPPFASDIRIELYKDVKGPEYYIRVLYCGSVQRIRWQMEDFYHWADFKSAIMKYLIREDGYWNLCRSNVLEQLANDKYKGETSPAIPAGM